MDKTILTQFVREGIEQLYQEDPTLYELLEQEYRRQTNVLTMVAASSVVDPSVLACEGFVASNVTAEGYPAARLHAGCEVVDKIERLAIERAKKAFGAQYANVQSHSASSANQSVMFSLLKPGDTILGMSLNAGGHFTHGAKSSVSGQYFNAVSYGLDEEGFIDYEEVDCLAKEHRPKLLICGATAYPRTIDFRRFRRIADDVGAILLADVSHIAGLIVVGEHPSPIDYAHITTTCTHKQLYGPRGGLILLGQDYNSLIPGGRRTFTETIQQSIFPLVQGAPNMNAIAAKARALAYVMTPEFKEVARRIVTDAKSMAKNFVEKGYTVFTGGTDNHLILLNILVNGMTGGVAERALEECNIIVNKTRIRGDEQTGSVMSGIRIGTNSLALRRMERSEMGQCTTLIDTVLSSLTVLNEREYVLDAGVKERVRNDVQELCQRFPIPCYPLAPTPAYIREES
ncbi:serine hydroxymethyltransferase [Dictyobacter arantiisoli]|uniref:Serine hydroxymethyltransferase n=1 Tax=Dictyobacter arantiisoli TaxID=2014874 RepID=A0A5A5TEQ7_9CHLR|nr:serine hydroxymethyltransferase [Dictyobacter arantiisoli]GCF10050.1 serine hydroxymethyltransferase [Dictyobacter arantiisoli]